MATKPNKRGEKPRREVATVLADGHLRAAPGARGKQPLALSVAQFIPLYLGECRRNATATAIAMGASPRTAHQIGHKFLVEARKTGMLAVEAQKLSASIELTTQRTMLQVMRTAYGDTRRFFNPDGSAKLPDEWDDDMAAFVASVEMDNEIVGTGAKARVVPFVKKLRFRDSLAASDMLMRHQGLFERDNRQRRDNLAVQINIIGGPPQPKTIGNGVANGKNGSHP